MPQPPPQYLSFASWKPTAGHATLPFFFKGHSYLHLPLASCCIFNIILSRSSLISLSSLSFSICCSLLVVFFLTPFMAFNSHITPFPSRTQPILLLQPTWLSASSSLQLRELLVFSYNPPGCLLYVSHLATIFIEHCTLFFPPLPAIYRHKLVSHTT
jgi:hypothetical protein